MKITKKIKEEFKVIKEQFDKASNHYVNCREVQGDYLEKKAENNCKIWATKLNLEYNTIIDLVFDMEHTLNKLENLKK